MLKQKYINVIRTCLKINRAFGNEKSKADIEETLEAFDVEIRMNKEVKKEYEEFKKKHNENNNHGGIHTVRPSQEPAPKPPGRQY